MKRFLTYLICGAISAALVTLMLKNTLPLLAIILIVAVVGVVLGELIRKFIK